MNRRTGITSLAISFLLTASCTTTGCRRAGRVGETVPSPPRELIEKSYQGGPAPAPGRSTGGTGGTANRPR
jgi:hypothetical protein